MRKRFVAFIAGSIVGATLTIVGAGSSNEQSAPPAKTKTGEPVVTPVAGPSWLNRLGLRYGETSLGRTAATYGPPPTQRPSPPSAVPLPVGRPVELSGADLYRLNCQSCHGAEGTGSPAEIKSVLGLVQGSSLELVRQRLNQTGTSSGSEARAQATKARTDLYQRIRKGGQRMPALAHLQEADINAIYAYLTRLAGAPDAPPQSRRPTGWARLGEHVVKGTCHICHDAVGPRPSGQALMQGTIPPFTTLLEDKPVVDFVTKVRRGAPVVMGDAAFHYRGRMPVFPFLQDLEVAAAYMYLVDYPPQAEDSRRR
jgi:mono/diheme cytochrome c family protein